MDIDIYIDIDKRLLQLNWKLRGLIGQDSRAFRGQAIAVRVCTRLLFDKTITAGLFM